LVPWLDFSVPGVLNMAAISASTFLGLYCYLLCVHADPGYVPVDYAHDPEDAVTLQIQVKRKGGAVRSCNKCSRAKPPRAHHCRVCQRCVRRMDHHCPWINGCVGHGNVKAFFLCLLCTGPRGGGKGVEGWAWCRQSPGASVGVLSLPSGAE